MTVVPTTLNALHARQRDADQRAPRLRRGRVRTTYLPRSRPTLD